MKIYIYNLLGTIQNGYKHSDEAKTKMSLAKIGKISPLRGRQHTEESKAKMRKSHSGKKKNFSKEALKRMSEGSKMRRDLDKILAYLSFGC